MCCMNNTFLPGARDSHPDDLAFLSRTAAAQTLFERKLGNVAVDLYQLTEGTVPEIICRDAPHLRKLQEDKGRQRVLAVC